MPYFRLKVLERNGFFSSENVIKLKRKGFAPES